MATLLENWVGMVENVKLPVLSRTIIEMDGLRADEASATPKRIVDLVLHDPMMTVRVLQFLQMNRNRYRSAEITTIARALMMLGTTPFFSHFREQNAIENTLATDAAALAGVRQVISRARLGALYAHDWARLRHDVDPEEILIATLLHDLAEIMLWCFAPALALEIVERQTKNKGLRSDDAQRFVIGFKLLDLQLELIRVWQLPELLRVLMDETRNRNPRVRSVSLATAVARHAALGWDNAALPTDYSQIADLLRISRDEAKERVIMVTSQAAAESHWYGVEPYAPFPTPEAEEAKAKAAAVGAAHSS